MKLAKFKMVDWSHDTIEIEECVSVVALNIYNHDDDGSFNAQFDLGCNEAKKLREALDNFIKRIDK